MSASKMSANYDFRRIATLLAVGAMALLLGACAHNGGEAPALQWQFNASDAGAPPAGPGMFAVESSQLADVTAESPSRTRRRCPSTTLRLQPAARAETPAGRTIATFTAAGAIPLPAAPSLSSSRRRAIEDRRTALDPVGKHSCQHGDDARHYEGQPSKVNAAHVRDGTPMILGSRSAKQRLYPGGAGQQQEVAPIV